MKTVTSTPVVFTLRASGNSVHMKRPNNRDSPRAAPH